MASGDHTRQAGRALEPDDYERLRDEAETHRERLVVRLAAEVGLRPHEMVALTPDDETVAVANGRTHYFFEIGGAERTAYLPRSVRREFETYVQSNDVGPDEPVFAVTARRLQMLVSALGDRTAAATGRDLFRSVSTADLHDYYARTLLVDYGLDPSVVLTVTGWNRVESLAPYVDARSRSEVAAAFDRAVRDREESSRATLPPTKRVPELDAVDCGVAVVDANATVEDANRALERVTGRRTHDLVGESLEDLTHAERDDLIDLWETVTTGDAWSGTLRLRRANDATVAVRTTVEPTGDGERVPRRFVATFVEDGVSSTPAESVEFVERLELVYDAISPVGDVLATATTDREIFRDVCECLADATAYEFAWISDAQGDRTVVPRAWSGIDQGSLERLSYASGTDGVQALASAVVDDGEVRTTSVASTDAQGEAGDGDRVTLVIAPIVHDDTTYGTLTLGTSTVVRGHERTTVGFLGERIGAVLEAVEHRRLLLADSVLELEFASHDDGSFLVAASRDLSCTIRLQGVVPLEGGQYLYYVAVSGASPERALDYADDAVGGARLVADYSDESLLEVTISDGSLAAALVDSGGSITELVAEEGDAWVIADFPPETDVRGVVEGIAESFPGTKLVSKQEVQRSVKSQTEFQETLEDRLTPKQLSVLEAAYHAGYFDWPRGSTAEELADSIGVSSPTLHNHLRRSQRKLLSSFFDDE